MNILFIAPLPPPITGHALASQVFLDELRQTHNVEAVNLSVGTRHDGTVTVRRLLEVAKVLVDVWRRQRRTGAIYLTISESVAGNLKDVLIYQLCAARLSRMYIHLHGGSIGKLLFDRHPLLRRINARFAPACFARTRLRSSRNTTSSTQCSPFSIPQWPRTQPANSAPVPR